MMKSAEDRYVEWARQNVALLAWRDDRDIRRIVRLARADVRGWRYAILIGGTAVGVMAVVWTKKGILYSAVPGWEGHGMVLFALAFLAGLTGFLIDLLVRNRIATIVDGA